MILLMILFWGIVIWATGIFVRNISRNDQEEHDSALDILKRRYATGEISREEFEAKRHEIT